MKKNIIIANWKMNLGLAQTISLTKDILNGLKKIKKDWSKIDIVLCPSFVYLSEVKKLIMKSNIELGAQDCFWEERGAYTGEISPAQLKEIGCRYLIIGHSERRQNLNETDEMIHKKVKAALESDLVPILCVGETFEERQRGVKDYVIINQVSRALDGINLKANQQLIIAYEPVWVIGTGQAVNPTEAEYVSRVILQRIIDLYPLPIVRNNIRIIYGGSVDQTNVKNFVEQETVDGILVGGASLKAAEFVAMINHLV
ncbi:MAG: triose-phosphate isomerase [Patescibacteria group bacterium]